MRATNVFAGLVVFSGFGGAAYYWQADFQTRRKVRVQLRGIERILR